MYVLTEHTFTIIASFHFISRQVLAFQNTFAMSYGNPFVCTKFKLPNECENKTVSRFANSLNATHRSI